MHRVVIITSDSTYFQSVLTHLKSSEEIVSEPGTVYEVGQFPEERPVWEVAVVEAPTGNVGAAIEMQRALERWKPIVVISIGSAIGIKDVEEGDIVAATHVYYYELGKSTESGFFSRPRLGRSSYPLEQRSKAEARKDNHYSQLEGDGIGIVTRTILGTIASGEKEIASKESESYKTIQADFNDALAVDTTGYGILEAIHAWGIEALVLRGITQKVSQQNSSSPMIAESDMANAVSTFAFEVLSKLDASFLQRFTVAEYSALKETIRDSSKGLLSWQRTLDNNQWIDRPELSNLLEKIETEESTTTIVLGDPGIGKSALMATLGENLIEKDYVVFAMKADLLSGEIKDTEDLQCKLHLSIAPSDAIFAIAKMEPIVVLIDQLDAVSELLDLKSERLSLLLSLIQRLSGRDNVHIVATCREFEFRYGSQFARLSEIERIMLLPPRWERVAPILADENHTPDSMGQSLRTLLQNPFSLNIFLEVASTGETFTSSQTLLERLWQKRVLKHSEPEKRVLLLERIAKQMTDEEVLWLPQAFVDADRRIFESLESDGILTTDPASSQIGFRHQTFYDHTLARGFSKGSSSLSMHVIDRQNGLFVRPVLLRCLSYLRGVSPDQYDIEINILLSDSEATNCKLRNVIAQPITKLLFRNSDNSPGSKSFKFCRWFRLIYVRQHIYSLLVEFVGAQKDPRPSEVKLFISLLKMETEGAKVLASITRSPNWIKSLRSRSEFTSWLKQPPERAVYCVPFLTVAAERESASVWKLLETYWLSDSQYDPLTIRVASNICQWTFLKARLIQKIVRRSDTDWQNVLIVAEKVAESLPDESVRIIRGYLEKLLESAIEEGNKPKPALSETANYAERYLYHSKYDPRKPIANILQSSSPRDLYGLKAFALKHPQKFLVELWPWLTNILGKIVRNEMNEIRGFNSYKDDELSLETEPDGLLESFLSAVERFATEHPENFVEFLRENQNSELLAAHRLLARGLRKVAEQSPEIVVEYLIADPRRLCIGDIYDHHRETKQLIEVAFPLLSPENRLLIESAIQSYDLYLVTPKDSPETRLAHLKFNRQHRLRLYLSIPDKDLSESIQNLKREEERAFPGLLDYDSQYPTIANIVGPPMMKEEMSRASSKQLIKLFEELDNFDGLSSLQRKHYTDLSRAGDAVALAHEFGKLTKDNPDKFFQLLPELKARRYEKYAGEALRGLAEANYPASNLISIVEELSQHGFSSESFCSNTADALRDVAKINQGLPAHVISLLESWLPNQIAPQLENYRPSKSQNCNYERSIFFDRGGSHMLPGGRGNIVRAIAEGYLSQKPTDLQGWSLFVESQIGVENHPAIWVDIVCKMAHLLNGDRIQATKLFDAVIQNCPEVLLYDWALYNIFCNIRFYSPEATIKGWLELLLKQEGAFAQQAYGELIVIYHFHFRDEWSKHRIKALLSGKKSEPIFCGMAHAACHLWGYSQFQSISAEILQSLAPLRSQPVQKAVSKIFWCNRENFFLDKSMKSVIQVICQNRDILLETADDLIEIVESENLVETYPELVLKICQGLLGKEGCLTNSTRGIVGMAQGLTTIAIQFNRTPDYRDAGLSLFEKLLALNLSETKSALETLDRKPNRSFPYIAHRRRKRRNRG